LRKIDLDSLPPPVDDVRATPSPQPASAHSMDLRRLSYGESGDTDDEAEAAPVITVPPAHAKPGFTFTFGTSTKSTPAAQSSEDSNDDADADVDADDDDAADDDDDDEDDDAEDDDAAAKGWGRVGVDVIID
jgi:hypothetical protein